MFNNKKEAIYENSLYNMLNRKEYEEYRQTISEGKKRENIAIDLKQRKSSKEFERKFADSKHHGEFIRDRYLPKFVPFVDVSNDISNDNAWIFWNFH